MSRLNPHFSPGLLQASCLSPYWASLRLFKIAPGDFVGILGQAGKAGWSIARGGIAVAMGEPDNGKGPRTFSPVNGHTREGMPWTIERSRIA